MKSFNYEEKKSNIKQSKSVIFFMQLSMLLQTTTIIEDIAIYKDTLKVTIQNITTVYNQL